MKRKGSGRTKGATGNVEVQLAELNRVLRPEAVVVVNRRYAEMLQLNCKSFKATTDNIAAAANQVQIAVTELEPVDYPDGPITHGDKKLKEMLDKESATDIEIDSFDIDKKLLTTPVPPSPEEPDTDGEIGVSVEEW